MKKIYVPNMDKLYLMQDLVGSEKTYAYLLIKAIESLIVDGINYPKKGILKSVYKYLQEDANIVHAIALLFPEELQYSNVGKYDVKLCEKLLSQESDTSIYNLDNLAYFNDSVNFNNLILRKSIHLLQEKLKSHPKYRFTYQRSSLLESIFSVDTEKFTLCQEDTIDELINIEPAYAIEMPQQIYMPSKTRKNELAKGIQELLIRYDLPKEIGSEYKNQDILTNPNQEVKRLIRTINHDKYNLY